MRHNQWPQEDDIEWQTGKYTITIQLMVALLKVYINHGGNIGKGVPEL